MEKEEGGGRRNEGGGRREEGEGRQEELVIKREKGKRWREEVEGGRRRRKVEQPLNLGFD